MIAEPDIAGRLFSAVAQLRRQIGELLGRHRLAARLFLGPDGQPTETAVRWLDQLGERCFAQRSTYDPDPRQHARNEGAREIYLEITRSLRLDQRRLAALTRQLRDEQEEDDE